MKYNHLTVKQEVSKNGRRYFVTHCDCGKVELKRKDWDVVTASLDRIDNTLGYIEGNVWWVHKTINRLKNNYSLRELLYWSKLLLDKHGNPERSSTNEVKVVENVQRLGGEDSTNNPPKSAQHPDECLDKQCTYDAF